VGGHQESTRSLRPDAHHMIAPTKLEMLNAALPTGARRRPRERREDDGSTARDGARTGTRRGGWQHQGSAASARGKTPEAGLRSAHMPASGCWPRAAGLRWRGRGAGSPPWTIPDRVGERAGGRDHRAQMSRTISVSPGVVWTVAISPTRRVHLPRDRNLLQHSRAHFRGTRHHDAGSARSARRARWIDHDPSDRRARLRPRAPRRIGRRSPRRGRARS